MCVPVVFYEAQVNILLKLKDPVTSNSDNYLAIHFSYSSI